MYSIWLERLDIMNWLEFFFGWLIKEQYKTTMLDGIMFWIEFVVLFIVGTFIYVTIQDKKDK